MGNADSILQSKGSQSEGNFIDEIVASRQGNSRFDEYASVFQNLTEETCLHTGGCVIVNIFINDNFNT